LHLAGLELEDVLGPLEPPVLDQPAADRECGPAQLAVEEALAEADLLASRDGPLSGSDEPGEERAFPEWKPAEQLARQALARLGLGRLASTRIGSAGGQGSADQVPGKVGPLLEGRRGQEQLLVAASPELVEKRLPQDAPLSLERGDQLRVAPIVEQA